MAATHLEAAPRVEIVSDRRRAHDAAFRAMVVAETRVAGARVHDVAARHGICPSLVYRWRRLAGSAGSGSSMHLFPVRIAGAPDDPLSGPAASPAKSTPTPWRAGMIEIELSGGVRVCVDEAVSAVALRRVISVLRR